VMLQVNDAAAAFGWKDVSSIVAIVISMITAYLSLFRRGKLQPRFGHVMLVQYQGDGRIHFKPEVSIHNPGARAAVIYHIYGVLLACPGKSLPLKTRILS